MRNKLAEQLPNHTLKRSTRAKRLRISVERDGSVVVVAPERMSMKTIEGFIEQKCEWIRKQQEYFKEHVRRIEPVGVAQANYAACKARAKKYIRDRVVYFSKEFGFTYNKISVKDTKSQWGSCSRNKDLSFSYKLLFLPDYLADYIIVHELAHTVHMNHSARYWKEVERVMPDYKERVAELKKYMLS